MIMQKVNLDYVQAYYKGMQKEGNFGNQPTVYLRFWAGYGMSEKLSYWQVATRNLQSTLQACVPSLHDLVKDRKLHCNK